MGTLVLIRHGMTEYNQQKRFTGFTDIPISEQGEKDAQVVGEKLRSARLHFDRAYTSWLLRAWQTLDIVLDIIAQKDLPTTKHPFLNERHYGDLQGRLHGDMAAEYGDEQVQIWRRSYDVRPPNGESLKDVVQRTLYYLEDEILPRVRAGENVLVCAHGNSNRSIVKELEHISDADIVKREIAYDEPLIYHL